MQHQPGNPLHSRIGFHYFADCLHYKENDLRNWLPELNNLGASWLTLFAPNERAIPESFLQGLLGANIEPVLHFHLPVKNPNPDRILDLLFQNYARWGVRYVALFDRPNLRSSWPARSWTQSDLVERFLDIFLPIAESCLQSGLTPVFPPLEPGGDYWDTAFLRAALHGIQRRGHRNLLENLAFGAYAWAGNRPLDWGAGGPERWPAARPYFNAEASQDHIGFRIFDWYLPIINAELGQENPILLLAAGSRLGDQIDKKRPPVDSGAHAAASLSIARLMQNSDQELGQPSSEPVPEQVLACNFWLLASEPEGPDANQAWFWPTGPRLPAVDSLRSWNASRGIHPISGEKTYTIPSLDRTPGGAVSVQTSQGSTHPISHYLLLPRYEWGIHDWHLELMNDFLKKYHPTVGFSLDEALLAERVTVIGGVQAFSDEILTGLKTAGCHVERLIADGTILAT